MTRPVTLASIIAAALAAGTVYVLQDPPECTPGDPFMVVVDAHVPAADDASAACHRVPVVTTCGEPLTLAWTIDDEAKTIDCVNLQPGDVRRVPTAEAYPDSLVGFVGRQEQGHDDVTIPAVPPAWGVCQGAGCFCAGDCESIPIGGPRGYWRTRLCRLHPGDERCPP